MGSSFATARRSPPRGLSARPIDDGDLATLVRVGMARRVPVAEDPWGMVVVRSDVAREALTDLVRRGAEEVAALRRPCPPDADAALHRDWCRIHAEAEIAEVLRAPVWLCAFLGPGPGGPEPRAAHSLALAVETLAIAAAVMGMRAISTIRHLRHEVDVRSLLGLPLDVMPDVAVAVGYPAGGHAGTPGRGARAARAEEVEGSRPPVFAERYGGPALGR